MKTFELFIVAMIYVNSLTQFGVNCMPKLNMFNQEKLPKSKLNINAIDPKKSPQLDPKKKNLVLFRFDEIFTSQPSATKFENVNNFVNFVINTFEPVKEITEVAIILTSGGGNALFFERAYSNLKRLNNHGYHTYALIDTVCASGCYMMACACDQIIAGNFSTIGSIGVFTKRYNAEKLSDLIGVKEIDFKTSNKKGDIPFWGHADFESINHIQNKLDNTMKKFTSIVQNGRPNIDPKCFDADTWYSEDAINIGLIDKIQMTDDFLKEKELTHNLIYVHEQPAHGSQTESKFEQTASKLLDKIIGQFTQFV